MMTMMLIMIVINKKSSDDLQALQLIVLAGTSQVCCTQCSDTPAAAACRCCKCSRGCCMPAVYAAMMLSFGHVCNNNLSCTNS